MVTDLDATIVFDRRVPPSDRQAMERWRRAGNLLAVDTGKSVFATRDVLGPSGVVFDYGVVFTGAVLIDADYEVLRARFIPEGVAQEIVAGLVDIPGVTTFATTIETDYILADNIGGVSSILATFSEMSVEEMAGHRFIGVPMRVADDATRDRLQADLTQRWAGILDCHRNQEFLDLVPAGATKGSGLTALLQGPLAGHDLEVWTIGDSWNDLDMHAVADHAVALPWSPPEVTAACELTVGSMAELIDSILEGEAP
ncbi:HAD hydrolase family protein [Actinomyces slackii]|nr:HAD family hydrolase [Actinomyces slackii]